MRKILFPTDFSDAANNAFLYALSLAKEMDAEIYVMNTYMQPVLSATHAGQPEMVPEVYENYELHRFESFKKYTAQLRDMAHKQNRSDIPLTFLFEEGTVVSNAQTIIEKEGIHLVVMGTNRATGIIDKIFGSNTIGVIRGVKVPVLSVPREASYQGIKEIVFTTLFRQKDEAALREILELAKKFGVKVKCVNVNKNNDVDIIGVADHWENIFKDYELEFVFLDFDESIENTLNKYIAAHKVDLLCVVKRNRTFLNRLFVSSISNRLTVHTNTATLILHEGDNTEEVF
ncbi:universal stress protein [Sphingobacterium psychroaquaticum]|uniref:Nucleotide-binding universal stress protein, UspA family n=1 Tax=Sphingobacterium psychroaquaticum TaxID=561061 RepID=A0A1X7IQF3_9SPHI|nr:universal stress protein [Sphingobacterium psychroaquaticum]QBQ41297.1 universal stress protein [Sphingobacterium psychroaquaticum]SMG17061.1 Nucleotide-binding universal stress protein, UspA family [Sphingobacterium psychroaquaticum]